MKSDGAFEPELVLTGERPIQREIQDQLRHMIDGGTLTSGEQLPTIRTVAVELSVNPQVVEAAYGALTRAGYVTTEEGSGYFVADAEGLHRLTAERRLRIERLCEHFLSCADAQGFSAEEALRTARALSQRSTP